MGSSCEDYVACWHLPDNPTTPMFVHFWTRADTAEAFQYPRWSYYNVSLERWTK